MAKLIALVCQGCGKALPDFKSGLSKCESCGTSHFLEGFDRLPPRKKSAQNFVEVEIPVAIAIGELLLASEIIVSNRMDEDSGGPGKDRESAEDLKHYRADEIFDDDFLEVGAILTEYQRVDVKGKPGGLFGYGRKTEIKSLQLSKYYFPMVFRFTKRQPYILEVYGRDQLTNAHRLAKMISDKLGYGITVILKRT